MNGQEGRPSAIRFAGFEVNLQSRELHRRGLRLKIEEKPFQILAALLERPGQVITRQELRQRLWTPGTYVDFDRNLNTAVNKLRDTLGDSAENPRFVETLSRRGYRFICAVEMAKGVAMPTAPESETINSIAVLPFENTSGDPEVDYLSDGITESLISNLSQLAGLRVMARSTVFRYRGRVVDPQAVGQELQVHAVLTGRLVQRGDTLVIGAELVSTDSGFRLWGEQYNRKLPDIFEVEEEISREISERLRLRLTGEERKRLTKRSTENAEAYRDYLKGRYCYFKMSEDGMGKSIGYFEDAIQKDPHYALAYSGLADTYGLYGFFGLMPPGEVMPRARELARIAVSLDDSLAEAHASLASIKKSYEWDWVGAENEYLRALELSPNYATGHHWYADLLSSMGRSEEAIQEIHMAQELDPLSLVISMEVAWNWYMARQYERSLEQSLKTLEIEPSFTPAQHTLGLAYLQLGRYTEAIRAFEKAKEGSGGNLVVVAALGHAYAASGQERQATKALSELGRIAQRRYVPHYWSAIVHAGLGHNDETFDCLERACEERDVWLVWLNAEPRFDGLRSGPRFENLLRRIKLVP